MSWDEGFADRYEEWSAPMTADVAFYAGLAGEADGPLVELGIGNGRVAIRVAQATGQAVIGIDSSPAILEQARVVSAPPMRAWTSTSTRPTCELHLDQPAALIYCPFRALLHVATWADRRRTFEHVAASLRPDGLRQRHVSSAPRSRVVLVHPRRFPGHGGDAPAHLPAADEASPPSSTYGR